MKIVIIGGTGLIGSKTVALLRQKGHDVVAASPSSGVNAVTGEGLEKAFAGAQVVVDVSNAPVWEDDAVLEFFEKSSTNMLAAEKKAGVAHHVALSVVGTERLLDSGYFRAKMAQEKLIKSGGVPYTILRATQFFEFLGGIAQSGADGETVRLSSAEFQPISSDDVAAAVADVALSTPANGMLEVAGPERIAMGEMVQRYLTAINDPRKVVAHADTPYFGMKINDQSLTPGANPRLGAMRFEEWMAKSAAHTAR